MNFPLMVRGDGDSISLTLSPHFEESVLFEPRGHAVGPGCAICMEAEWI